MLPAFRSAPRLQFGFQQSARKAEIPVIMDYQTAYLMAKAADDCYVPSGKRKEAAKPRSVGDQMLHDFLAELRGRMKDAQQTGSKMAENVGQVIAYIQEQRG